MSFFNLCTRSVLYVTKCLSTVAPRRNGLEITPNGTRQKRYYWMLFDNTDRLSTSFNHRNLVTSLWHGCKPICKNAFSMSDTYAVLCKQNLMRRPHKSCNNTGPLNRHSFRLLYSALVFAEASYTTRSLLVDFCGVITAWCGI